MLNFWKASRLGASKTTKAWCPAGSVVQAPSILAPCFFNSLSNLPRNSNDVFLDFSLNQSQFSGECLAITIKVGIQRRSELSYWFNLHLTFIPNPNEKKMSAQSSSQFLSLALEPPRARGLLDRTQCYFVGFSELAAVGFWLYWSVPRMFLKSRRHSLIG